MKTSDKAILVIVKLIAKSLAIGTVSFIFMALGMKILEITWESKVALWQVLFVIGFMGLPLSVALAINEWAEKEMSDEK